MTKHNSEIIISKCVSFGFSRGEFLNFFQIIIDWGYGALIIKKGLYS